MHGNSWLCTRLSPLNFFRAVYLCLSVSDMKSQSDFDKKQTVLSCPEFLILAIFNQMRKKKTGTNEHSLGATTALQKCEAIPDF